MALLAASLTPATALPQRVHDASVTAPVQPPAWAKPPALLDKWGDQGDGTYVNPILPGDFSDTDAIRVGQTFYMISSTMQYAPGMVVLQSSDMVNWRIIGHVVKDISALDPALNWDSMSRAGRGIWAGSVRHVAGQFRVYFGTPNQGIFVSTAADAAGPWTPPHLVLAAPGWDDPCSFIDDDGQGYLVTTHFLPEGADRTTYNIHLFKLSADGLSLLPGYDRIIHRSKGSEANKLYKIDGLYYHYYSEVKPEGRVAMIERSKSLEGPWQSAQLMHVHGMADKEPNQGGLIELPSGKWYFLSHQGKGDWEGRATVLLPVHWVAGWPILGRPGPDGIGEMVWRGPMPILGGPRLDLALSDGFDSPQLQPTWEWRYQPDAAMWSLTERPGYLRLHASRPLRDGGFDLLPNVLTQRSLRTRRNEFTVKLDLSGMQDGQEAGLAHFARTHATISVTQVGHIRSLSVETNGTRTMGPAVDRTNVWLRSDWDFSGNSYFSYSFDGLSYHRLGGDYLLSWGDYRGDRVGLFTSNDAARGCVDIDSVQYETTR